MVEINYSLYFFLRRVQSSLNSFKCCDIKNSKTKKQKHFDGEMKSFRG